MLKLVKSDEDSYVKCLMPNVKVYLVSEPEVLDPFNSPFLFRGEECFDGSLNGWRRWQKPSPEPKSDPLLKRIVLKSLNEHSGYICALHDRLLEKILKRVSSSQRLLFVCILRAGVFVAQGLAKRMTHYGYDEAPIVAIGLFNEAGFDRSAFSAIVKDYPKHYPIFVDGWTGRGIVARELKRTYAEMEKSYCEIGLPQTPLLATLVDPGHHGDLYGTDSDIPVPCAHFTAPEVFGFSRAVIKNPLKIWSAYRYPEKYYDPELVNAWLNVFNSSDLPPVKECSSHQLLSALLEETARLTKTLPNQWKVNVNEVVRSFVNRIPRELVLGVSEEESRHHLPELLYLADRADIPVKYLPAWGNRYNCLAAVRVK